ncbi:MAG TPA: acyl-CoA dehydrogenase family protein, partial [Terriglobales bacterium]|nr:acyl-CoA dehydrogenase family protein [Terriglobales bacterium]
MSIYLGLDVGAVSLKLAAVGNAGAAGLFAARAAKHDAEDSFVAENFAVLKERKLFSAMVTADLGGGGASHGEMCETLRELGRHCSSTALTLSM